MPIVMSRVKVLATGYASAASILLSVRAFGVELTPIHDPRLSNIGLNCHWEARSMKVQRRAMTRALTYIWKTKPAPGRLHRCNRIAARGLSRIDWVGFDQCIHNHAMDR